MNKAPIAEIIESSVANSTKEPISMQWRVNTPALLKEIVNNNPTASALAMPIAIFGKTLCELAEHAATLHDPKLDWLMCRLALYAQSDPYSPDYDRAVMAEAEKRAKEAT